MKTNAKVWDWRTYILKFGPENSTYRHVLLTLSCYMDSSGGSCFPAIDTLVKVTCLSKPTVIKYLKKAHDDGWIITETHGFSGQGWRRNQYTANLPEIVVKEVNHHSKRGKTDKGTWLNSQDIVVKQVNPISPYNSSNNSSRENTHAKDFEIPKKLEVIRYFSELGYTATVADSFYDHYQSNGWMVGSNKMIDWKASARRWVDRMPQFNENGHGEYFTQPEAIGWLDSKNIDVSRMEEFFTLTEKKKGELVLWQKK